MTFAPAGPTGITNGVTRMISRKVDENTAPRKRGRPRHEPAAPPPSPTAERYNGYNGPIASPAPAAPIALDTRKRKFKPGTHWTQRPENKEKALANVRRAVRGAKRARLAAKATAAGKPA